MWVFHCCVKKVVVKCVLVPWFVILALVVKFFDFDLYNKKALEKEIKIIKNTIDKQITLSQNTNNKF